MQMKGLSITANISLPLAFKIELLSFFCKRNEAENMQAGFIFI